MRRCHETVISDPKDIPAKLPQGVNRADVEAEWNHVPLFEPPLWWDDGNPPAWAGGKSWMRFLVDEWHKKLLTPPTAAERRQRKLIEGAGRALTEQLTQTAIDVLTEKCP